MTTLDERIDRLTEEVSRQEGRVEKAEEHVRKLQSPKKDFWDKVQAASGTISGILVLIIGFLLNDSVKSALEERQLQLANVKEMQQLLVSLPSAGGSEAEAAALTLAAFGRFAVAPLIGVLDDGRQQPAAESGLRAVGLTDRDAVCESLVAVLNNRTGLYRWTTHRVTVRLIGGLQCNDARRAIGDYNRLLDTVRTEPDLVQYRPLVRDSPVPTLESIGELREEIARTKGLLK